MNVLESVTCSERTILSPVCETIDLPWPKYSGKHLPISTGLTHLVLVLGQGDALRRCIEGSVSYTASRPKGFFTDGAHSGLPWV